MGKDIRRCSDCDQKVILVKRNDELEFICDECVLRRNSRQNRWIIWSAVFILSLLAAGALRSLNKLSEKDEREFRSSGEISDRMRGIVRPVE